MSLNDQESINDYLMNHKTSNYSNMNTTKLTEISQIMNYMDQKQNYQLFQNLDNPSPVISPNSADNQQQLLSQFESTPYHLQNQNLVTNSSNLSSLPHTEQKNEQHPYFSNISPVSRFQTKISQVGSSFPISGSSRQSQITPSNSNYALQQAATKAFTPSNNIGNRATFQAGPSSSSFTQSANHINHSNNTSISSTRINAMNKNNIDFVRSDENQYQFSNNLIKDGNQHSQLLNAYKYQVGQDNTKIFFKSEQSPNSKQNLSTKKLLAQIKSEDEFNYQREMMQADQYLTKIYQQKHGLNNSREELPPNFGAILAKRTSPPLKGKNTSSSRINIGLTNANNSQNQSGILQLTTIQSQSNLNNNNSISGLANNQSVGQMFSNNSQYQKNCSVNGQKNQFGAFGYQTSLNQTHESIKNKNAFAQQAMKDERGIQESKAYLQAMKALQERIKELEKQLSLTNEQEIKQYLESQYQQTIEESGEIIENINQKNIILEQQINHLLNEIEQYKGIISEREGEFQIQREEWLKSNAERNNIIESHIQKQAQLNGQLQQEIERSHQMQIELNETQQKWQILHQEHQLVEARRIEQLQNELDEEKAQHNELKSLCLKSTEELETLLAQNKALDNKLQFKEKEFDEYKIHFNQGNVDLLKDQIKEQKEYLEMIEDKIKQTYESKQIQLETELNNSRLIEKQLRNEILEIKKGIIQRSKDQLNHSIHSPQSQHKITNNQVNSTNTIHTQDTRYSQNINNQMGNNFQLSQFSQNNNQQNKLENTQGSSQTELEKYLTPGTPNGNNNNNNNQIQQLNQGYNPSIEQQLSLNQNQLTPQQQNQINLMLLQNSLMNNKLPNQIPYQQNQLLNQQQIINSVNNQMSMNQQYHHVRGNSNQNHEIEHFSLQEESDLLNFDYDELQQQSRLNSKSSPILNSRHYKQIMSLDSPLRKKSTPYNNSNNNVSSSLQITKQFQNTSLQNSLNNNQYSFMQSQNQQQDNSPQNIQNIVTSSPFYSPSYPNTYDAQLSPDFKPSNINSLANPDKNITHKMNLTQGIKDNWSFKDQIPLQDQMSFENTNQMIQQKQLQQIDSVQQNMNKQFNQPHKRMDQIEFQQKDQQQKQILNQILPSTYLQYSDTINNELEYKKQAVGLANKRSKSSNQSLHKQQQPIRTHKSSVDNVHQMTDEINQEYPSNVIGNELIRDIFEAESEQKLLNQRYEVLLTESRNEENSKKKSDIRKELITISEKIKILNEKLYVLKKREKFIMSQQYQKNQQNEQQEDNGEQNQVKRVNRQQQSSSQHQQQDNY